VPDHALRNLLAPLRRWLITPRAGYTAAGFTLLTLAAWLTVLTSAPS
jgi:hypothetical protein